jgi:hypothetical protein
VIRLYHGGTLGPHIGCCRLHGLGVEESPVVREQLKRAGVRLAHLINAAAAGTLPVNMLSLAPSSTSCRAYRHSLHPDARLQRPQIA